MFIVLMHHYNQKAEVHPQTFQSREAAQAVADEWQTRAVFDEEMRGTLFPRTRAEVVIVNL